MYAMNQFLIFTGKNITYCKTSKKVLQVKRDIQCRCAAEYKLCDWGRKVRNQNTVMSKIIGLPEVSQLDPIVNKERNIERCGYKMH